MDEIYTLGVWPHVVFFEVTATRIIILISPIQFQNLQVYHRRAVDEDHFSVDGLILENQVIQ
jgi:hypothetical protein